MVVSFSGGADSATEHFFLHCDNTISAFIAVSELIHFAATVRL